MDTLEDRLAPSTAQVKDIVPGAQGSDPGELTNVNGTLFFTAWDAAHGYELWRSNGTPAGTALVKDINPGPADSNPGRLTNVNGTLFFAAEDPARGTELWRSDGTAAGTVPVKDIWPGSEGSDPGELTNVNGTLYFTAYDGTGLNPDWTELWMSDGTEAGTVPVKDIYSGGVLIPSELTNVNGTLFFTALDPLFSFELRKTDGTPAGTVLVKDIYNGPVGSSPSELTNVNGTLFFVASDSGHRDALWRSDGTDAGTVLVKDLNPGPQVTEPGLLTDVNGTLYFVANGPDGDELWRSDGTDAGTVQVKDINPGPGGSNAGWLTDVNGTLFFAAASDGTQGTELWKSDGTEAGTVQVAPASGPSAVSRLTNVNGTLFFNAWDVDHGYELWRSDGTAAGTTLVKDIDPGSTSSDPIWLTNVNGTLFFNAWDVDHGYELWKSERVNLSVKSVSLKPNDRPGTQPDGNVYFRYRVLAPVLDRDMKIAVFWGVGDNADIDLNNPVYPQSGATADVMKMTVKRGTKAGLSKALLRVPKAKLLVAPPGATSLVFVTDPENMRLPDGSRNPDWEGDRTEVNVSTDLTPDQLLKIMKRGGFQQLSADDATRLAPLLANYMNQAGITSLERRAMFLAQAAVETDLLRQWAEAGSDNYFITNYWLAKGKWSGLGLSRPTRTGLSLRIPGATAAVPQKTFELYWSGGPTLDFSPTLIGSRVFKKVANWYEFEFDNTDAPPAHTTHLLVVDNSSGNPVVVSAIKNTLGNWRVQDVLDFRGRGLLHLTGRANYQAFFDSGLAPPDLLTHPDLLSEKDTSPAYGIQSGVWYWSTQTDLNTVTDSFVGQRPYDFTFAVSKAINGINPSTKLPNGFPQRLKAYWGARSVLLVPPTPDDSPPLP